MMAAARTGMHGLPGLEFAAREGLAAAKSRFLNEPPLSTADRARTRFLAHRDSHTGSAEHLPLAALANRADERSYPCECFER